jgi:L-alanine-DL-glutamate epimerase-like enolase superfamily enzyme
VASAVRDVLAPQILGEDPGRIEFLWQKMYRYAYRYGTEGVILCGLSGIDLALWDLLGKRLGAPVAQMLGGTVRDAIRAYASLPPLGDEKLLRVEIERAVRAGFRGVKLHELEVRMAAAAREALPEGMALMFDVNGRFTPLEAAQMAKGLARHEVTWFEEPIWPMQDHLAMARVRRGSPVPLAAGENEFTLKGLHGLMTSGAVDYVMPEITKIGGLSRAVGVSTLAELFNVTLSPHNFRPGPALYANIHWALSRVNMDWLEVPWLPEAYGFPAGVPLPPMDKGMVKLPEGPGLGMPPGRE